jgi:16S rRNA (guanine1516-N2)-methyltransferase
MNQPGVAPLAVTTVDKPAPALVAYARRRAEEWRLPFFVRGVRTRGTPSGTLSIEASLESALGTMAEALLVFGREGLTLWDREGRLHFHPGMAHLRLLRLEAGEEDTFVRVAELRAGDHVLDATLGLGQDALVAARAVGPGGRVVGIEKSLALYAVVSEGLRGLERGAHACAVEAVHADARDHLARLPDRSFDVVFFDPMFERPRKAQPAFAVLRRYAEHAPLTPELLAEARRVARRWVVIKGSRYSDDLKKLGLTPEPGSRYASVAWGKFPSF